MKPSILTAATLVALGAVAAPAHARIAVGLDFSAHTPHSDAFRRQEYAQVKEPLT